MAERVTKGRNDWIDAAAATLVADGPERVSVEPLAKTLGVTKGSFYWHFKNRRALLDAVIDRWEHLGTHAVIAYVESNAQTPRDRLLWLWKARHDDHFEVELAIRAFATRDSAAHAVVARVDKARFAYLRKAFRGLGCTPPDAEARSMLYYSLLTGDHYLVPAHGRMSRKAVLNNAITFLLAPPSDANAAA